MNSRKTPKLARLAFAALPVAVLASAPAWAGPKQLGSCWEEPGGTANLVDRHSLTVFKNPDGGILVRHFFGKEPENQAQPLNQLPSSEPLADQRVPDWTDAFSVDDGTPKDAPAQNPGSSLLSGGGPLVGGDVACHRSLKGKANDGQRHIELSQLKASEVEVGDKMPITVPDGEKKQPFTVVLQDKGKKDLHLSCSLNVLGLPAEMLCGASFLAPRPVPKSFQKPRKDAPSQPEAAPKAKGKAAGATD
jgi:hypothetical protein